MISSITLLSVVAKFRKSLLAQIVVGVIGFLGVWKINNMVVESKAVAKVVKASKDAGKKRNDKSRKIRARIKPGTAMQRLRREYADGN